MLVVFVIDDASSPSQFLFLSGGGLELSALHEVVFSFFSSYKQSYSYLKFLSFREKSGGKVKDNKLESLEPGLLKFSLLSKSF